MTLTQFDLFKNRGHGAEPWNQNPSLLISHRQLVNTLHISVYTYPRCRNAAISGVWNEHFLWQPAHLIHLTLKKTEHLWQTGQWKIEPWILIVEVNEQIGLEVCHLSASRDALVWIHPGTSVSPVTSWRKQHQGAWSRRFGYFPHLTFHQNVSGYPEDVNQKASRAALPETIIQTLLQAMF